MGHTETLIAGVLIALIGAVIFCVFLVKLLRWFSVRNWPSVSAEIVEKWLQEERLHMWPAPLTQYVPSIKYVYDYRGTQYAGRNISVRDKSFASVERHKAQKVIDEIANPISVHVNPKNPNRSYIYSSIKWRHIDHLLTFFLCGFLIFLAGVGIIFIEAN